MKKTVLITGTSSGFSKATARHFARQGWNVVATLRQAEETWPSWLAHSHSSCRCVPVPAGITEASFVQGDRNSRGIWSACSLLPLSSAQPRQSGSKLHALQTLARGSVTDRAMADSQG